MALEKFIIQEGQNIFDIALLKFGTLDELFSIFVDNPDFNINTDILAQDEILIDTDIVGRQEIKTEYLLTSYVTNNADNDFIPFLDQKQFQDDEPFDFQDDEPYQFN